MSPPPLFATRHQDSEKKAASPVGGEGGRDKKSPRLSVHPMSTFIIKLWMWPEERERLEFEPGPGMQATSDSAVGGEENMRVPKLVGI